MKDGSKKVITFITQLGVIGFGSYLVSIAGDIPFSKLFWPSTTLFLFLELIDTKLRLDKVSRLTERVAFRSVSKSENERLLKELEDSNGRIEQLQEDFNRKLERESFYHSQQTELKSISSSLKISDIEWKVIDLESNVKALQEEVKQYRVDYEKAAQG